MAKRLPVASHLTDGEYMLFAETYAKHNSSMSMSVRERYNLVHVVKVERNIKERCLNVHYDNGEWFKYHVDGTWS